MGLKRIVAPAPILSVQKMKTHLRIDHDDDDDWIEDAIASATDLLDGKQGELQRCLMPQAWEYTLDRFPADACGRSAAFEIPLPPLIEVSEIRYVDGSGGTVVLSSDAYEVDVASEPGWVSPVGSWPSTMDTVNAVTVEFRAGYEAEGSDPAEAAVPPRVIHAVKLLVSHWYENRDAVTADQMHDLPLGVAALIKPLRILYV